MSLSLSVLATILFLAPGISGFLGGMLGASGRSVRPSMPPANSLSALVAIVLIAVAAHGVTALLLLAQHGYCRTHRCLAVDPNLYGHIVNASRDPHIPFTPLDVCFALVWLLLLCAATGLVSWAAISLEVRRGPRSWVAPTLYGWLAAYSVPVTGGSNLVIAYVLTKMRGDNLAIGYRGILEEINLTADREIASITLVAADRFGVRLAPPQSGSDGTVVLAKLLPRVHVPGREIENIVLNAVPLGPSEPDG